MRPRRNATYRKAITSRKWLALRKIKLTLNPLCQRCESEGRVRGATEVHHIRPVESVPSSVEQLKLLFDYDNLLSVCHDCHVRLHIELKKGTKEDLKKRNENLVNDAIKRFFE